jgi:phosphatidylserine/phosphatidylglycerophosphate/cardiolipin synthase-like enzyme
VTYDGAKDTLEFLRNNPNVRIEIITNSVMTSDNFFTQAVIDMDMAPRLLLTPEMTNAWRSKMEEGEFNPDVVESAEWKKLINHPQIFIYQTGKLDSVYLGGQTHYGKLHAKYITGEKIGFIGTSNFDYRSNLYNNEMGFFFQDLQLIKDLNEVFEWLKATSYRWGTPEWLQMRKDLMASDSKKASPARKQRGMYKTMKGMGIIYLF